MKDFGFLKMPVSTLGDLDSEVRSSATFDFMYL